MTQEDLIDRLRRKVEARKAETQTRTPAPRTPVLAWLLERQRTRFTLLNEHFSMLRAQSNEVNQARKISAWDQLNDLTSLENMK